MSRSQHLACLFSTEICNFTLFHTRSNFHDGGEKSAKTNVAIAAHEVFLLFYALFFSLCLTGVFMYTNPEGKETVQCKRGVFAFAAEKAHIHLP